MKEFTNRVFFRKWGMFFFLACTSLNADNQTMPNFEIVISQDAIQAKVKEVAKTLDQQYKGKDLTLVLVMKGALCIGADLIRALTIPCTVEYIRASSYGHRGIKRGELTIEGLDKLDLTSKDVLLVDDIFDTGVTLSQIAIALEKESEFAQDPRPTRKDGDQRSRLPPRLRPLSNRKSICNWLWIRL